MGIEILLTIISLLLVVLTLVTYQLIISIRKLPSQIAGFIIGSIDEKLKRVAKEIDSIKDDLGMD